MTTRNMNVDFSKLVILVFMRLTGLNWWVNVSLAIIT